MSTETDAFDRPSNKAKVKLVAMASVSTTINYSPKIDNDSQGKAMPLQEILCFPLH